MNKFKSFGFWTALAGAVTVLASALGRCFGFSVDNALINDVIMAIAGLLVVLGVVTMPKKQDKQDNSEEVDEESQDTTQNHDEEK